MNIFNLATLIIAFRFQTTHSIPPPAIFPRDSHLSVAAAQAGHSKGGP